MESREWTVKSGGLRAEGQEIGGNATLGCVLCGFDCWVMAWGIDSYPICYSWLSALYDVHELGQYL